MDHLLSGLDQQILVSGALGRRGRQDAAVRLGLSSAQFHQRLGQILDDPAALEAFPILVGRLRRVRGRCRRESQ